MYHYIHIIDQHPLKRLGSFMFVGEFVTVFLHFRLYRIGYRFYLGAAACFTNDKEVGYGFRDLS